MRWTRGHQSTDLIDRRGAPGRASGGLFMLASLLLRFRYGWLILLVLLGVAWGTGMLGSILGTDTQRLAGPGTEAPAGGSDPEAEFVGFVLDDVQKTWEARLASGPVKYRRAKLVLFTDATETACGFGQAATGPFYCPSDQRVYIDLGFFRELDRKFGAPGDFAQAYVIAHEVGHHVQNLLGLSDRVRGSRQSVQGASGPSVRLELQADCFAGIWAHFTAKRDLLEKGDLDEGLRAASAIGDDRLQRQSGRTVNPESFTHGSSAERTRWFRRGYEKGTLEDCDTFATN